MAFDKLLKRRGRLAGRKAANPTFEYDQIIGENYADSVFTAPANNSLYGVNVDHGAPIGILARKRDGFESLFPSLGPGKVLGLHNWQHSTGDRLMMAWDKNLYLLSGESGAIAKSSQEDWEEGVLTDVEIESSPGDIKLFAGVFSDIATATEDFDGTHENTKAIDDSVVLDSAVVKEVLDQKTYPTVYYSSDYIRANLKVGGSVGQTFTTGNDVYNISKVGLTFYSDTANITVTLYDSLEKNTILGSKTASVVGYDTTFVSGYFVFDSIIEVEPNTQYYIEFTTDKNINVAAVTRSPRYEHGNGYVNGVVQDFCLTLRTYTKQTAIGTYTHGVLDPSAEDDAVGIQIIYNNTTPANTRIKVQTRVSHDNGDTWDDWQDKESNDLIIECGVSKKNLRIQWRALLLSYETGAAPSLNDVTVISTYANNGNWISPVYDLGNIPSQNNLTFTITQDADTSVAVYARGSSSGTVFGDWLEVINSGDSIPLQRYIQIMFVLKTDDITKTPTVSDFVISYSTAYTKAHKIDVSPLGRVSDMLTGNRVRFCNYQDWLLMADGLRPFMAYITTDTQNTGTAQSAETDSITLESDASELDGFYTNAFITITDGPGKGKVRWITAYDGATKKATISEPWSKNILTANQASVETDTTGFKAINGATISRDTTEHYDGIASLKVVVEHNFQGFSVKVDSAKANTVYTASFYIKKGTLDPIIAQFKLKDYTNNVSQTELIWPCGLNTDWTRYSVTVTTGPLSVTDLRLEITKGSGGGTIFFADAIQIEEGPAATPFAMTPDNTSTYSISSALKVRNLGIDPPTVAPSGAAGDAGSPNGSYRLKVTYVNRDDVESNPSPESETVTVTKKKINWTIPVDSSVGNTTTKRRLYRTAAGGAVYKFLAEITDNTTTTYEDDIADAALGSLMLDNNNIPPLNVSLLYEFTSYVFYVDGYEVWFSKAGAPDQVPNIPGDIQQIAFPDEVLSIGNNTIALMFSGENFDSTITSNTGFVFDSDITVDTTTMKIIEKNGGLSQEATVACLSPRLGSTLFRNTKTGIRLTRPGLQDNSVETEPESKNIQPYYQRSIDRDQAAGVFFNDYYLYSMTHMPEDGGEAEYLTFAFDLRTEQWYGPWTFGMSCYAIVGNVLYAGDVRNGKVYRMFSGSSDDGEPIHMILDLPVRSPGGEAGWCKFHKMMAIVSSDSNTTETVIKPKVDSKEASIALGTLSDSFAGDKRPGHNFLASKKHRIPLPKGRTISYRIEDNSTNPLKIEKIVTEYEVLPINR